MSLDDMIPEVPSISRTPSLVAEMIYLGEGMIPSATAWTS